MAAKKKPSPAYAFAHAALTRNPNISFADLATRAKAKRINIAAVLYGKAKLDLGLVKRGQGIAKKKAGVRRGPGRPRKTSARRGPGRPPKVLARRGPGRPPKAIASRGPGRPRKLATLDSIANQIRDLQTERDQAVDALNRIRQILG